MSALDPQLFDELYQFARAHLSAGNSVSDLEEALKKECSDIVMVTVVVKEAKEKHYAELQKDGIQKIVIGAVLGLLGCVMTLLHFGSGTSFQYALFGFTTVGISMVFYGMYRMIG
jgi:hypothetical protein